MNSDEYQELAALWSGSTPADDEVDFREMARRTPRLAWLALWGELVTAALLAFVIGAAMIWNMGPTTMLIGSLILLLLGWSAWKRHRLGYLALLIDDSDRLTFVRSTLRAKEAERTRSVIELALVIPGVVLALLLGFAIHFESGGHLALGGYLFESVVTSKGLVAMGFLLCAVMLLIMGHLRLCEEIKRLRLLRDEYEAEARLDEGFGR